MSMSDAPEGEIDPADVASRASRGQRLQCEACGSEVEIVSPSTSGRSRLEIRCCGRAMAPTVGRDVNLGVE